MESLKPWLLTAAVICGFAYLVSQARNVKDHMITEVATLSQMRGALETLASAKSQTRVERVEVPSSCPAVEEPKACVFAPEPPSIAAAPKKLKHGRVKLPPFAK
jgi:hypothetical protein